MKLVIGLMLIAAALAMPLAVRAQQLPLKLLVLPVPGSPQVFMGDGKTHVAYELFLANFTSDTIRIDSLNLGEQNFAGDRLKSMFSGIGAKPMLPQDPVLKPGEGGVIYLFLYDWKPTEWSNSLTIEAVGKPESRQNVSVDMTESGIAPFTISSPLRGKNWWTPNGPANDSTHRRVIIALGNHFGLPERLAVDWLQLGTDGKTHSGNQSDNHSYHCYGLDIIAVADGKVVSTKDGIPENVPNSPKMAVPITLETIGGNYVMEDMGGGHYAFYAHMIPGTVAVKPGDQVKRGQLLGKLGNSGNSSEPHLHFHICDAPNPLFCNGLPFGIDHFTRYDYKMDIRNDEVTNFQVGASHQMLNEIFMNMDFGDFSPVPQ